MRWAYTSAESLLCFRPLVPAITSPMRLIWRKEQQFPAAAALFLGERKETARDGQKPFYENCTQWAALQRPIACKIPKIQQICIFMQTYR